MYGWRQAEHYTQYKCHVQFFAANLSHSKECVWPLLHATAQTFLWLLREKAFGVVCASAHKINAKAHKMLFAAPIWHYYS
jgi:hypothetical protein